ncbi:cytochrome P450 [Trematosphaeria pertusa]|uniref:Cytochrome P450 n=1 Tax=Trematosphaeria pertusa TaxID=390896 RepID=A0A6A6HRK2_9PLEO|nr:cytochrome P450 [Trematosphaeria pertusa]KAF2240499.1 cytochrome P450 [Trematosphaeria pertusa]
MFPKAILLAASAFLLLAYTLQQRRRRAKLPPGPPRLPIIGNLHQAPKSAPWLTYQKWIQEYGPLVSADFGGTTVILVGDFEMAKDLLDRRATIYSGRPRLVMAAELTCKGMHILLRQPDAQYVLHQRLEAPALSPRASTTYTPIQDMESKVLLHNFLKSNDLKKNFEIFAASVVYVLTYGFRIVTNDEWQIQTSHEVLHNLIHAAQPGKWMVDALPMLKYLPAFLAPFKKTTENYWQLETNLHITNMKEARERESWNWCKDFANAKEVKGMSEVELAWDLGILCDAGVETSAVFLQTFALACVAHPDFMAVAQKEIDDVVGQERMPDFADLEKLPYIHAIVEENFRWRHILPASFPHATLKEDWYNGYLIPKSSIVIPVWKAMREDEKLFDAPLEFRPERWIGKVGQPNNFGYGRRICTGRHIAKNSVTIAIARILWGFNVRSKDGTRIQVDDSMFAAGFVSHPKPFEAIFEPRSETHRALIEREFENVDKDVGNLLAEVRKRQVEVGLRPRA